MYLPEIAHQLNNAMKIPGLLVLSLILFQSSYAQDSLQRAAIAVIQQVDSLLSSPLRSKLITKEFNGATEPFSRVDGNAFLNAEKNEVLKIEMTVAATQELVTYYCIDNTLRVIVTHDAMYCKHNDKYFAFPASKMAKLLTEEELRKQDEFLNSIKMAVMPR